MRKKKKETALAVTLSITVTDAQAARCQVAFGHRDPVTQLWVNATANEIRAILLNFAKSQVQNYEARIAAEAVQTNVGAETW